MKKVKIVLASLFTIAVIAINFSIVENTSNNSGYQSLSALKQALADDPECDVIITPGGGGTEGAILLEGFCPWPYLGQMWAECHWTGDCDDVCWFGDEEDCS